MDKPLILAKDYMNYSRFLNKHGVNLKEATYVATTRVLANIHDKEIYAVGNWSDRIDSDDVRDLAAHNGCTIVEMEYDKKPVFLS
jgi:hypothetical protein